MSTLSKRFAYKLSDRSRGAPRDEGTGIIVFWKIVGGLVAGLALVLLVMNLLGEISFRRTANQDPFQGVYRGTTVQEQQQNFGTQPDPANRPAEPATNSSTPASSGQQ